MPRLLLTVVLSALIGGCSALLVPTPSELTGQWGGVHVNITDSLAAHGVLVDVGCAAALFPSPIAVDSLGNFLAYGAIISAAYPPNTGRRTRISGRIVGDSLALDWTWEALDPPGQFPPPEHFQLKRGRAADWSELFCTV